MLALRKKLTQKGRTSLLHTGPAGEPSVEKGARNNRKSCSLNWDRERRKSPDYDSGEIIRDIDRGEWVKFQELEEEVNAGCEKCSIIYSGVQKYRQEFEGRDEGGASIYKTASGVSCQIHRKLREGELRVAPVHLLFFTGKGEANFLATCTRMRNPSTYAVGEMCLTMFKLDNRCPWLPVQTFPKLASGTDSSETFSRLRRWIDTCAAEHKSCSEHSEATLPARVLDLCMTADENGDLQLYESQNEIAPYATLSHCWGSRQPLRTTKATLDLHRQKVRFSDLTKTFQDATATCRRLGIRYLWIDSLCIVQDDEEDWQLQSAQMASIYEGSTLTIAASSANDGTEGCFLSTPERHCVHTLVCPGNADGNSYSVHVRREYPHPEFWDEYKRTRQEAPLFGRAWFYQERFLSRRVVHFTKCELWWECQTVSTCECEDSGPTMTLPSPKSMPMDVRNRNQLRVHPQRFSTDSEIPDPDSVDPWHLCVRAYSLLSLTFEKDVFPALSGLAGRVQDRHKPGFSYYAGIWLNPQRNDLNDLLWINDGYPKSRLRRWRAPSWSWASVIEIMPKWMELDPQHIYAKLLDVKTKPYGLDSKGELRDAYIRILAPGVLGSIQKPTVSVADRQNVLHPRGAEVYIRDEPNPGSLRPLVRLDVNPELCKPAIVPGTRVFCLRLGRQAAEVGNAYSRCKDVSLCLRFMDYEEGEPVFERIGIATHDHVLDPMAISKLHSIKIV